MKKQTLFSFFIVLCSVLFVSCSGDVEPIDPAIQIPNPTNPTDPNNPGTGTASFKADFNNQTFVATNYLAYVSGGSIIVTGFKSSGENFSFVAGGTTPGTYPANSMNNLIVYQPAGTEYGYSGHHPTNDNANTGSIVVTNVNTQNQTVSGTFAFTGYWTDFDDTTKQPITFTNGVFTNIPYVTENPTNDTFFARINGVEFVDTDIFTLEIEINNIAFISVYADDINDNGITVSMRSNLNAGTYNITGNTNDVVQLNYVNSSVPFNQFATSGSVTITEKTATRIKGTFNANVIHQGVTYQITQGAFDVEY